jgi:hypothetical protein
MCLCFYHFCVLFLGICVLILCLKFLYLYPKQYHAKVKSEGVRADIAASVVIFLNSVPNTSVRFSDKNFLLLTFTIHMPSLNFKRIFLCFVDKRILYFFFLLSTLIAYMPRCRCCRFLYELSTYKKFAT